MFLASGDAKHIDVMELAVYNSVLSGVSLSGTEFFYTNPLRVSAVAPVDLRWSRTREPFVTSFCCPPNVARTIAEVGGYAYGKSDKAIWVNLYGSNTLDTRHPLVEETRNHLAVKRGPLVYCLESVDLAEGTSLADVKIPAGVKLQPRFDEDLFDGVTVVEGTFLSDKAGDWKDKLYREFKHPEATSISIKLVPYYTWSNRGASEMSVWLPLN